MGFDSPSRPYDAGDEARRRARDAPAIPDHVEAPYLGDLEDYLEDLKLPQEAGAKRSLDAGRPMDDPYPHPIDDPFQPNSGPGGQVPSRPTPLPGSVEEYEYAETVVALRQEYDIFVDQGENAEAAAVARLIQKLPVSDAIKADPQKYIDDYTERQRQGTPPSGQLDNLREGPETASGQTAPLAPAPESYRYDIPSGQRLDIAYRLRAAAEKCPLPEAKEHLVQETYRCLRDGHIGDGVLEAGASILNAAAGNSPQAATMKDVAIDFCQSLAEVMPNPQKTLATAASIRTTQMAQVLRPAPAPAPVTRSPQQGMGL